MLVSSGLRNPVHRPEKSPAPTPSGNRVPPNIPAPDDGPICASTRVAAAVPEKSLVLKYTAVTPGFPSSV